MLTALLAQAAHKGSFWMPEQASTVAPDVDWLYDFTYYLSLFFFVLITLLLTWFIVKYRHREDGHKHEPAAGHSTALELTWTLIPAVLVLVIFYYGFRGFMDMTVEPPNPYEINVNGRTWSWTFTYENQYVAPDGKLHIPVNTPIRFVLSSEDVIHSFFVPEFRTKKDAVPGRYNRYWVQATKTGEFPIYCAEYCGELHSRMVTTVVVHEKEEFKQWLEKIKDLSGFMTPLEAGQLLYKSRGCNSCHTVDGSPGNGPTFKDLFGSQVPVVGQGNVLADENYIRESILYPQAKVHQGFGPPSPMPPFLGQLNDWEIGAIIAYMKSISKNYTGSLDEFKVVKPRSQSTTAPTTAPAKVPDAGPAGNKPTATPDAQRQTK